MRKLIAALTVGGPRAHHVRRPRPIDRSGAAARHRRHGDAADRGRRRAPNPLEDKRRELKETAIEEVIAGSAQPQERNGSTVVKVGETERTGPWAPTEAGATSTSSSRTRAPTGCSRCSSSSATSATRTTPTRTPTRTRPGRPASTAAAQPDPRARPQVDNTTIWQPDFSQELLPELYFGTGRGVESLKTYYEKQSSGRYSVDGDATAWVTVPFNEAALRPLATASRATTSCATTRGSSSRTA